ncbi:folliculin [Aplysia californica]|uniref:Folliculin n=1 Tax=Aplysia californica TaxID=6500 RepID=A0ABM1W1J6_APLCA|nr:folliculin [Aplysia californica]XP_005091002.1 folliculin [Aplysia californica]XP_005091003.1 folliculin [Aplysia californica]XP_005091004.1 folliculin [Aplysia californica]XP_005091006.1 folliculin [Aplysia californica]XP_035828535.1 folliculin [Aplysia californica]XP_035828539.1 folliculin [Aplysia californica]
MNAIISLCHFCEFHGPRILYCTQPFRPQESKQVEGDEAEVSISHRLKSTSIGPSSISDSHVASSLILSAKDHCEGCKSVHTGYVSHDEDAQVSYVSTQQPYNPEVFTRIRQACIRSLSVEVCPGRVGPIFYGDKQYGYVLSYTFSIPDNQARGMHRSFSILVVMMDKIYLLNSWPFLVPHLRIVIENLQNKAQKIYDQEEAKCPQRPYRLGARVDPSNFIKQRGGNKPARSLQELTGDKNVFRMLHVAFLWILKACGNRISETLLEGPPTEDTIIDMEKQEETEEGFIKIYTRKVDESPENSPVGAEASVDSSTEAQNNGDEENEDLFAPVIKNLRHLKKVVGSSKFLELAHHVVVGNQVIVSGRQRPLVKSFLTALKSLLPKGCCRVTPYSKEYEESWKCNFLGLSPDVSLSQHVTSSEMFYLVEIIKRSPAPEEEGPISMDPSSLSGPESDASEASSEDCLLRNYEFRMSSPVSLPAKVPTVLEKMMMALQNENLCPEVVETAITCLKEEWMNKVKVLFKFTKAGGNRSEEDTRKLLQIVGARDEDKQLLKFWMTGLSVQYRTHILASSAHR